MARNYSSTVEPKTLTSNITDATATQITLNNVTGLPSPPYILVINPDTAKEEVVLVNADQTGVTSPTLKVTRAIEAKDGVGVARNDHTVNNIVKHMIVGSDLQIVHDHFSNSDTATGTAHGATGGVVGRTNIQTITNKTINLTDNTLTGTKAQFNAALSDADFTTLTGTETLTNKTLTSPTISSPTISGTITGAVVTSANIVDGTIVDADINASAAITQSKISNLTTDLGLKAPLAGPTFTGTVVLPSTTSIGTVSSTEIGYIDGVTSAVQTQLDAKLPLSGGSLTGNVSSTGIGVFTTNNSSGRGVGIAQPSGDATPSILQFTNNAVTTQRASISANSAGELTLNPAGSATTINGNVTVTSDLDASGSVTATTLWADGINLNGNLNAYNGGAIYTDTGSIYNYTSVFDGTGCRPINDNASSLGTLSSQRRWTRLYAVNTTISSSDERDKIDVTESPLGLDFINNLRPVAYRWKVGEKTQILDEDGNPVFDENGESVFTTREGVRKHYGLISQEVKQAIDNSGVDDFAGWVKDDMSDPESHQSLSYEQFLAPLIKAVQELSTEVETLKAKVAELEAK